MISTYGRSTIASRIDLRSARACVQSAWRTAGSGREDDDGVGGGRRDEIGQRLGIGLVAPRAHLFDRGRDARAARLGRVLRFEEHRARTLAPRRVVLGGAREERSDRSLDDEARLFV